jgi:hypothetical protein
LLWRERNFLAARNNSPEGKSEMKISLDSDPTFTWFPLSFKWIHTFFHLDGMDFEKYPISILISLIFIP